MSPKQEIVRLQNQTQQIANIAEEIENDEYCNEHDHDAERPESSAESVWDRGTRETENFLNRERYR